MKKQSTLNLTIYLTITQLLLSFVITNNVSIYLFPKAGFLVPLVTGFITILFILILPKIPLRNKKHNFFIKSTYSLYYIVFSIIILMFSTYIINYYFYPKTSFFLLTLLFSLVIMLLSTYSTKHLYDVSLTIFILIIFINFILIFNTSFIDLDLLFNIDLKLNYKNFMPLILLLGITLEPINNYLLDIHEDNVLVKRSIIISTLIASIISSIIIFINYLYYSDIYLMNTLFPSFSFIFSLLGPEFIDHFTIVILFNTIIYSILKISMNISIVGSSFKHSSLRNFILVFIIFFLSNLIYKYSYLGFFKLEYVMLTLLILILPIYFFIILNKKEKKDAITSS